MENFSDYGDFYREPSQGVPAYQDAYPIGFPIGAAK